VSNTLYLTHLRVDYLDGTEHICYFYETCYQNVLVSVRLTTQDCEYIVYYLSEFGTLIVNYSRDLKSFYYSRLVSGIRQRFLPETIEGEGLEYYFDKFIEKYPIMLPDFIPNVEGDVAKIFRVVDPNIQGIQETLLEFEDV